MGSDEERAQVEITTGVVMSLPVGSYNYVLYGGCNIAVNVINRGMRGGTITKRSRFKKIFQKGILV